MNLIAINVASHCPSRALANFCTDHGNMEAQNQSLFRKGTVEGEPVDDIILDTGSTRTLVHHKLLPPNKRAKGVVTMRCAHGPEVTYPLTEVGINFGGEIIRVEAGISRTLPVSVLLGTDVPQLVELVNMEKDDDPTTLPVGAEFSSSIFKGESPCEKPSDRSAKFARGDVVELKSHRVDDVRPVRRDCYKIVKCLDGILFRIQCVNNARVRKIVRLGQLLIPMEMQMHSLEPRWRCDKMCQSLEKE